MYWGSSMLVIMQCIWPPSFGYPWRLWGQSGGEKKQGQCESHRPLGASGNVRTHSLVMENMECLLSVWIEDQNQCHVHHAIQAESRSLFNDLNGEWGESCQTFNASRGWFEQFKWCSNLHNIKMAGEVDTQINRYLTLMKPGCFGNKSLWNLHLKRITHDTQFQSCQRPHHPIACSRWLHDETTRHLSFWESLCIQGLKQLT